MADIFVVLLVEAIRGKAIEAKYVRVVQMAGIIFIIILDVLRYSSRCWSFIWLRVNKYNIKKVLDIMIKRKIRHDKSVLVM